MGCNPTKPITITVYDPNVPQRTGFVQEFTAPGSQARRFVNTMGPSKMWEFFFVDTLYVPEEPDVAAGQAEWRWCTQCMGLFFNGHPLEGCVPEDRRHAHLGVERQLLADRQRTGPVELA